MAKQVVQYDDAVITAAPIPGAGTGLPAGDLSVLSNMSFWVDEEFLVPDGFELLLETNATLVID